MTGLARDGTSYAIDTPRGRVTARRVLIASGGWSAQIAAMLGTSLPIRGAPLHVPGNALGRCTVIQLAIGVLLRLRRGWTPCKGVCDLARLGRHLP